MKPGDTKLRDAVRGIDGGGVGGVEEMLGDDIDHALVGLDQVFQRVLCLLDRLARAPVRPNSLKTTAVNGRRGSARTEFVLRVASVQVKECQGLKAQRSLAAWEAILRRGGTWFALLLRGACVLAGAKVGWVDA